MKQTWFQRVFDARDKEVKRQAKEHAQEMRNRGDWLRSMLKRYVDVDIGPDTGPSVNLDGVCFTCLHDFRRGYSLYMIGECTLCEELVESVAIRGTNHLAELLLDFRPGGAHIREQHASRFTKPQEKE